MAERLAGGCHCGTVRFEISGPLFMACCHCGHCRKACGAPYHTVLTVPADRFRWLSGRDRAAGWKPPAPFRIVRDFCPDCGCTVGELLSGLDPLIVSAAILDGDPGRAPIGHEWVTSAAPWHRFDDGRPCFAEGFPPASVWRDAEALAAARTDPPAHASDRPGVRPTPGSCLCGGVRFEVDALSEVQICHCLDCRRSQGGERSVNGTAAGFRVIEGEALVRAYASSPGKERCFCGHCGATLFARQGARTRVRLASLDADPGVDPEAHIWVSRRVPWQTLPSDVPTFEQEAP